MEVRASTYKIKALMIYSCALFLAAVTFIRVAAQPPVKAYTIKDGKMYISLSKKINETALDSFITSYNLYDLGLKQFVKTKSHDSLSKQGWKFDVNNSQIFVISKALKAFNNINNPADKIIFTEKHPT